MAVEPSAEDQAYLSRAIEAALRIGIVAAIAAWCFQILGPFIVPIAWGVIIAVAVHPIYARLRGVLGGRAGLAAGLLALIGVAGLILPTVILGETLAEGTQSLAARLNEDTLTIPPPPDAVRDWPLVGKDLHALWSRASENLAATLKPILGPIRPQLVSLGTGILSAAAGIGFALLQTLLSILVAGVFLAHDRGGTATARSVARRLAGKRGPEFADTAGATVRSVTQGILGVALIQSFLAGVGFVAVGVPGAGLWALIGLILCVVQLGIILVMLPVAVWVWLNVDTTPAVIFTIWAVIVTVIDNFLKPMLLGRGMKVPMLVILLGSVGGFIWAGIVGLFVGAVVLVVGYMLLAAWLDEGDEEAQPTALPASPASGTD